MWRQKWGIPGLTASQPSLSDKPQGETLSHKNNIYYKMAPKVCLWPVHTCASPTSTKHTHVHTYLPHLEIVKISPFIVI